MSNTVRLLRHTPTRLLLIAAVAAATLVCPVVAGGPFDIVRAEDASSASAAPALETVDYGPYDDDAGVLDDALDYYYLVRDANGDPVELSADKNPVLGTVRLGFDDGDPTSADRDPQTSSVTVEPAAILADGTSRATVTMIPRDSAGVALGTGLSVTVDDAALFPGVRLGPVEDHGNGVYTVQVVSSTPGGGAAVAIVEGVTLAEQPTLLYEPMSELLSSSTLFGGGSLLVGGGQVIGNVAVNGNATLHGNVAGDVSASGSVINPEYVSGTVTENAPVIELPGVACPTGAFGPVPAGPEVNFKTSTGNLSITKDSDVTFSGGIYFFHDFKKTMNGNVIVPDGEVVVIYLSGELDLTGKGITNPTLNAGNLRIWGCGDDASGWTIDGNNESWLEVYAPNHPLNLGGSGDKHGTFIGDAVVKQGNGNLYFSD